MSDETTSNKTTSDELIRGIFVLVFLVVARIVGFLVGLTAVFQFFYVLIVRKPNENALQFGRDLSRYTVDIIAFLSYNTDTKPWPFTPFPKSELNQ